MLTPRIVDVLKLYAAREAFFLEKSPVSAVLKQYSSHNDCDLFLPSHYQTASLSASLLN